MLLLILFAFIGGLVTILSPCILPILPIVLSGSITGGKRRPAGVVVGFVSSFTFFTLFLTAIVKATGVSADGLRFVAVAVIGLFGLSLLLPKFQKFSEKLFSKVASAVPAQQQKEGFWAGVLVGISLGLVWTPCVGPILAGIITLAATSRVGFDAVLITLAYSLGTSIPLVAITIGGRKLLTSHPKLLEHTGNIQKLFGVLMIITAIAISQSWDRKFQTYILLKFPNYGVGLTKFEDNEMVKKAIEKLQDQPKKIVTKDILKPNLGLAPELILGGQWFNISTSSGQTPTIQSLRGKVVLVDFWTYTCINCIRTLPYLQNWHEKYKNNGLVIIGVHTPEFEFEKDPDNVAKAINDFGLEYLIMQDNDYATWTAYSNRYWPAKYLIDKDGVIRYTHFGEGDYDETETVIQDLIMEAGMAVEQSINNPTYQVDARTRETYLGYLRLSGLVSPEPLLKDAAQTYSNPTKISRNSFALGGIWTIGAERAHPSLGATLTFHFDAKEVFLVMRPRSFGQSAKVKINLNEGEVDALAGDDVDDGVVTVDGDRLYKLIKLPTSGAHILKLEFLDDNAELYAFTFG